MKEFTGLPPGGHAPTTTTITSCTYNCGARCLLKVHVKDGLVDRITGAHKKETPRKERLNPCLRGRRALMERLYDPDRLKYPLKRVGKRGEGKFARVSWEEATTLIADQLVKITEKYGPQARYVHYASGIMGALAEKDFFRRLLSIYGGGYLDYLGSYSTGCTKEATSYTFGTYETGSSRDNWLLSRLIILWGHNPVETSFGNNTSYLLKQARKNGAKIVVVDPRYSDTAASLADEWIPLLPTTDNALMDAMTYVMITEGLYDKAFVKKFCLGFDESGMPPGIPAGESLTSYILGKKDGIAKTPEWAEKITRVPAAKIHHLARDYATLKPAALLQGWGPQRHAYGEQPVRGATVLAAITGNVGIPGGWASGSGNFPRMKLASIPHDNPVKAAIPVFTWSQVVEQGGIITSAQGLKNAERLENGIKFIASLAGNALINQHADINRTKKVLQDESKCEFILVSDEFMTTSAQFADLVLPSTNFLERIDIIAPWDKEHVIFQNKAVEPQFERRTGHDWICQVAEKLGVLDEFTQGKSYEDWARYIVDRTREVNPGSDFPSFEDFIRQGIYRKEGRVTGEENRDETFVAFRKQVEDFTRNPFPTPSGKIEIFSPSLYAMGNPGEIPAIPRYISSWEGPQDPMIEKYPLQLIGWHSKRSTHSTMSNSRLLKEIFPHCLWIHPDDAAAREVLDGEKVRVFNGRGAMEIKARVTEQIMQGVVAMPQGAWYDPGENGVDRGGCINILTKYHPTPLTKGNSQHTSLVQVEKLEKAEG